MSPLPPLWGCISGFLARFEDEASAIRQRGLPQLIPAAEFGESALFCEHAWREQMPCSSVLRIVRTGSRATDGVRACGNSARRRFAWMLPGEFGKQSAVAKLRGSESSSLQRRAASKAPSETSTRPATTIAVSGSSSSSHAPSADAPGTMASVIEARYTPMV